MAQRCEVCSSPEASETSKRFWCKEADQFEEVLLDGRIVELCSEHAELVLRAGVTTIAQVRALFAEPFGHRSLIERRMDFDRRMFPARPEGRRHDDGRRATDTDT